MEEIVLETKDLNYVYHDGTHALKDVNLKIKKGEKVAVMGPNGAGKSTLFLHFNGLIEATSGLVKVSGKTITRDKQLLSEIRQKVGIVFQNPNDQLFAPSVEEDIAFGPMNLGLDPEEVKQRTEDALKMVGMEGYEKKAPYHLSGGQQKRVAIAGIIAMKPEIIILDEPTSGLDPQGVDEVLAILDKLHKEGISILISSHDVELINEFAEKIFVLKKGKIIEDGTPEEIFSNHDLLNEAHLKPPKLAQLLKMLNKNGLNVENNKIKIEECCNEIIKAKINKN